MSNKGKRTDSITISLGFERDKKLMGIASELGVSLQEAVMILIEYACDRIVLDDLTAFHSVMEAEEGKYWKKRCQDD
ncbi:MAG: hypothetical protein HXS54_05960 [Theionarchaea archaeon]|nr:hypothetical protein [Theionarchaea archaeon]DBA34803.1 TPA_asm: hypothetical protein vir521_00009 [Caudoviricetes sp. vir521]